MSRTVGLSVRRETEQFEVLVPIPGAERTSAPFYALRYGESTANLGQQMKSLALGLVIARAGSMLHML
jgi:hypothetical protein